MHFWQQESLTEAIQADLSNEVHPLFEWSKFSGDGFDAGDEATTLMARRLASRYVTADCLLPFWYALLLGKRTKSVCNKQENTWYEIEEPPLKLTATQVDDTRSHLIALASNVTFNIERAYSRPSPYAARCWHVDEEISAPPFAGLRSIIDLSAKTTVRIRHRGSWESDSIAKAWATVEFAGLLGHEIAHAAIYATLSPSDRKGREFENRCLGGVLGLEVTKGQPKYTAGGVESKMGSLLRMIEWPYSEDADRYQAGGSHFATRGKVPRGYLVWRVPLSYLQDQLSNIHWEGKVKKNGLAALRPERKVALAVFDFVDQASLMVNRYHVADAPPIPEGFKLDASCGEVRRKVGKALRDALGRCLSA